MSRHFQKLLNQELLMRHIQIHSSQFNICDPEKVRAAWHTPYCPPARNSTTVTIPIREWSEWTKALDVSLGCCYWYPIFRLNKRERERKRVSFRVPSVSRHCHRFSPQASRKISILRGENLNNLNILCVLYILKFPVYILWIFEECKKCFQ